LILAQGDFEIIGSKDGQKTWIFDICHLKWLSICDLIIQTCALTPVWRSKRFIFNRKLVISNFYEYVRGTGNAHIWAYCDNMHHNWQCIAYKGQHVRTDLIWFLGTVFNTKSIKNINKSRSWKNYINISHDRKVWKHPFLDMFNFKENHNSRQMHPKKL